MVLVITKVYLKTIYHSVRTVMRNVSRKAPKIRTIENSRSVFSVHSRYRATKFTINIR